MIYPYCFAASTFFAWLASRSKDKGIIILCSVISILIPSILGGLRATGVGGDTQVYGLTLATAAMNASDFSSLIENYPTAEGGYMMLTYIVMQVFGHENWCYFFYQFITVSCVYICAYKHRKTISMPFMFLLWLLYFYNNSYNIIRQSIAASIIFMNIDMLEKKQYKKFLCVIAVAYLFHHSSLIALVLIFGIHYVITSEAVQKNLWLKIVVLYGSIALLFVVRPVLLAVLSQLPFGEHYVPYFFNGSNDIKSNKILLLLIGVLLAMMFFYRRKATDIFAGQNGCRQNIEFFRYNLIFCAIYSVAVRFATGRVLMYTEYINILILSSVPSFIKEKHLKFMATMSILALEMFTWWLSFVHYGVSETYPYRSIL